MSPYAANIVLDDVLLKKGFVFYDTVTEFGMEHRRYEQPSKEGDIITCTRFVWIVRGMLE